jgi:cysteinyl-tRNA synthetase
VEIRFYNSLTRTTDLFEPQDGHIVKMYSCGPTVYDFAHIGNFRSFLAADLVRRFLEAVGYEVWHVMNITDVGHMTDDSSADGSGEDKMQVAAKRLKEDKKSGRAPEGCVANPDDPFAVAAYYRDAFLEDGRKLGLKVAFEYPQRVHCATNFIPQMIKMIERLIERGHAYVGRDKVVYYDVKSFPDYGRLSGNTLDKLENLQEGASGRLDASDQANKRNPADFMLWKPDPLHVMKWDSPWGAGYPGWHIECSAMAIDALQSPMIDIHTGGEDLIFPHHECEIAQARGSSGCSHFAKFWLHTRFLMVEGEKMSKSKGNFFTVRDVLSGKATGSEVHPAALRYELIRTQFGTQCNFTLKGLVDSANAVRKLIEFSERIETEAAGRVVEVELTHPVLQQFFGALADNLNISAALAVVHQWIGTPVQDAAEAVAILRRIDSVLAVVESTRASRSTDDDDDIKVLCQAIHDARQRKDFSQADEHRKQLEARGYEVRSTKEGTVAKRKMA